MSKDPMSKIRANDTYRQLARVLAEFGVREHEVRDRRPHPLLVFTWHGAVREFSFPGTPSSTNTPKRVAGDLRRSLRLWRLAAPVPQPELPLRAPPAIGSTSIDPNDVPAEVGDGRSIIPVLGRNVLKVEYRGERVVTLKQIDELHEKAEGQARKQFNAHRQRFEKDRDFIEINASEFRTSFPELIGSRGGGSMLLLTERGYGKIVKGWNDDLAWSLHDAMQEAYFTVKEARRRAGAAGTGGDDLSAVLDLLADQGYALTQKIAAGQAELGQAIERLKGAVLGYAHKSVYDPLAQQLDGVQTYQEARARGLHERDKLIINLMQTLSDRVDAALSIVAKRLAGTQMLPMQQMCMLVGIPAEDITPRLVRELTKRARPWFNAHGFGWEPNRTTATGYPLLFAKEGATEFFDATGFAFVEAERRSKVVPRLTIARSSDVQTSPPTGV